MMMTTMSKLKVSWAVYRQVKERERESCALRLLKLHNYLLRCIENVQSIIITYTINNSTGKNILWACQPSYMYALRKYFLDWWDVCGVRRRGKVHE